MQVQLFFLGGRLDCHLGELADILGEHKCTTLCYRCAHTLATLMPNDIWGQAMSQISNRLNQQNIRTFSSFTAVQRSAVAINAAPRARGREYSRRLCATDLAIVALASGLPFVARTLDLPIPGWHIEAVDYELQAAFLLCIAWMTCLWIFKTHSLGSIAVGMKEYKLVLYAGLALAGIVGVCIGVTGQVQLRNFLVYSLPAGFFALILSRWAWRQWLIRHNRSGYALSNVLIYGQATDLPMALQRLNKSSRPAYRVVGLAVDGPMDEDKARRWGLDAMAVAFIGSAPQLEQEAARLNADAVIVVGPLLGGNAALQQVGWTLEHTNTKLIVASSLTGVSTRRVSSSPVDGMPLLHVESAKFSGFRYLIKRSFDIVFSFTALLLLLPVFLIIAGLIKAEGPGKLFFLQERAGQDGKPFKMVKFRTMVEDAESQLAQLLQQNQGAGPLFKLQDDPRVTRTGRWLRRHSLDELPQFLNVLRGEMSVVGPRPPLFREVAEYNGFTHRRLLLKPGVTGLWQVSGRSNLDWNESIRLDLYYAENWTLASDLRIIWRTFRVMIRPEGAY